MKKGNIPKPESYESVSIFLCDIVGFTSLSSESTAHQIVDMLNLLYNMFDARIDNWDVYKVETIGDAYMVASGVPEKNDHHALEVSRMGLELLAKVISILQLRSFDIWFNFRYVYISAGDFRSPS